MNKRILGVLGGVAVLIGIGAIVMSVGSFWGASELPKPEAATSGSVNGAPERKAGVARARPTPTPAGTEPESPTTELSEFGPNSAAAGHQDVAAALGYTMIRCFVGPDFPDDELVGRYVSSVEDGWFSTVVTEPSGEMILERRIRSEDGRARDWEPVAVVRWASDDSETTLVECSMDPVVFGSVEVRVTVDGGGPVEAPSVFGCGGSATPIDGVVRLDRVLAPGPCTVRGMASRSLELCSGTAEVDPVLADQVTSVDLTLECVDVADALAQLRDPGSLDLPSREEAAARSTREYEALLAYSEARPRTGDAAALIDDLLERWAPRPPLSMEETLRMASDLLGDEGLSEEDIQSALDLLEDAEEPVED
ncbi:MAG: hypothetical protein AB8H79_24620 [Myxococcota bacterium]